MNVVARESTKTGTKISFAQTVTPSNEASADQMPKRERDVVKKHRRLRFSENNPLIREELETARRVYENPNHSRTSENCLHVSNGLRWVGGATLSADTLIDDDYEEDEGLL